MAEHGLPPLALAKQYKIFVGPERYSIKDCPEYDFAFRTLSLGDELDPMIMQQVSWEIEMLIIAHASQEQALLINALS